MEKFSVRKPFTVLVMVIIMIVFGLVCLGEMDLDMLPEMDLPYIMVLTTYPGASPEKVEEQVCKPLESALAAITGVQNVYSVSNENYGMVQLEFVADTDMDAAMVKISNVLSQMEESLPEECGAPSLLEIGTDMIPFAYFNVGLEDGVDYRL